MSNNEQNYRPLGPNEVIQEGDEGKGSDWHSWRICGFSIGDTPKEWPGAQFRRPIPAETEPKGKALSLSLSGDPDQLAAERAVNKAIVADLKEKLAESEKEAKRLKDACSRTEHDVQQIAGKALGYPWFKDDQTNFPGATEADGVCVGEHVAASIVSELASKYAELQERIGPIGPGGEDRIDVLESSFEHLNFRVSESEKKNDNLQAELTKCREALGAVVEMTDLYRLSPKWREKIKAALEGGK